METVTSVVVGWTVGAFVSASLDSILNPYGLYERSPILAGIVALAELSTIAIVLKSTANYFVYDSKTSAWEVSAWLFPVGFFTPRAIKTLVSNYNKFHIFLYNPETVPHEEKSCCDSCENGGSCEDSE